MWYLNDIQIYVYASNNYTITCWYGIGVSGPNAPCSGICIYWAMQCRVLKLITTLAKGPPFCKRCFPMHFRELFVLYFKLCCTDVRSWRSDLQYHNIGLDNDLAPNRRKAIIWTNADSIHWRIYTALEWDELKQRLINTIEMLDQSQFPIAWK